MNWEGSNIEKVRRYIGKAPVGEFFIYQLVKSDLRMPYGGNGNSGYGRELSREGKMVAETSRKRSGR